MKKTAFLGLALIAIGILAIVSNYNQPVISFFSSDTEEINESKVLDGDKITSIDIQSSSPNVYLMPSEGDEITIDLKGKVSSKLKDSYTLDVSTDRNTLKVDVNRKNKTVWVFFGIITTDLSLDVYVPEKMYDTISINTSSGEISVDDFHAKDFDILASSGSISVSNLIAEKELNLTSSSGRIEVIDSRTESVNLAASSGSIALNSLIAENINVATSSGKIELSDTEGEISAAASSGSISIDNERLNGNITASTSSGRVEINLEQVPSAVVDFKGSSGKGNVTIPEMVFEEKSSDHIYGKIGSGDYQIKVRTSSGGFDLH